MRFCSEVGLDFSHAFYKNFVKADKEDDKKLISQFFFDALQDMVCFFHCFSDLNLSSP